MEQARIGLLYIIGEFPDIDLKEAGKLTANEADAARAMMDATPAE